MKKTVLTVVLLSLVVLAFSSVLFVSALNETVEKNEPYRVSVDEKILIFNKTISNQRLCYHQHVINGFLVKNDYIQVLYDAETGDIIEREQHWTDVESIESFFTDETLDFPVNKDYILWSQPVVFAKQNDLSYFYQLHTPVNFPLYCWELRLNNGETILVDRAGEIIGEGVPTPLEGMTLSGYAVESHPDYWAPWRYNANSWFSKWCDSYVTLSLPTIETISTHVSNPDHEILYEIAHSGGVPTRFQANAPDVYYTATRLENDMADRSPITFALLCSCEAMRDTGPGTLSYEFRKGEMQDTVTIGYIGMESCPGWSVSLEWQDYMFYAMNAGNTIKDAFDLACIEYPTIADCVAFVGDTDLIIFDQGDDDDDDIGIPPHIFVQYPKQHAIVAGMVNITGTADDLDGTVDHIFLQIDDGDWIEIDAGSVWEYSWDTTTVPDGNHLITVVAVDDTGLSSGCTYVHLNVSNTEVTAAIQCDTEVSIGEEIVFSATVTGGIPPYSFHWDFGDGNTSSLLSPIHGYDNAGEYNVDLTVTDLLNHSCETNVLITVLSVDTTPPTITMKKPRSGLYLFDSFFCSFPVPVIIGPITFQVSITENESTVDEVHFFIDEQQYQTFSEPPYEWMWDEINCGTVQFRCTATDSAQNMNSITQSMIKLF